MPCKSSMACSPLAEYPYVSVHGANRMGGNSLLDACLFGTRAGKTMATRIAENPVDSPMADDSADDMLTTAADHAAESRKSEPHRLLAGQADDVDEGSTANRRQLMAQLGSVMEQALAVRCTAQTIDTALAQLNSDIKPVSISCGRSRPPPSARGHRHLGGPAFD